MQENQDGGVRSSSASDAGSPGRVEQDPEKVRWRILSPGYIRATGSCLDPVESKITSATSDGSIFTWDRWELGDVALEQTASLLLLQGMELKRLFNDASLVEPRDGNFYVHQGPFVFLKGTFEVTVSPPRITGVVLARLREDAANLLEQEVLGALVLTVLPP